MKNKIVTNSNNKNNIFNPVAIYSNADTMKSEILKDNRNKVGVYCWTNLLNGKFYVGSSVNLGRRFRDYYNYSFLEGEIKKNNSRIYKALIKYGYSNFKLEILEYCEPNILIEREQYYFDLLNPEYNILKKAGSLLGFKHSEASKELMSEAHKNLIVLEETKLKISVNSPRSQSTIVIDNSTGEIVSFASVRKAAEFIGIHTSYLAKSLNKLNFYLGRGFLVHKSNVHYSDIINSKAYINAQNVIESGFRHSEESKELIRKANLGRTHSFETIQKLSANSANSKAVVVSNNETQETIEFPSITLCAKYLSVDESYVRQCINRNKACKGYTIIYKTIVS